MICIQSPAFAGTSALQEAPSPPQIPAKAGIHVRNRQAAYFGDGPTSDGDGAYAFEHRFEEVYMFRRRVMLNGVLF